MVAPTPTRPARATPARPAKVGRLDAEVRELFRHRLVIGCVIAAGILAFLAVCAATNFIELISRRTVGWPGLVLAGATLVTLNGVALYLMRRRDQSEVTLRALEIAVFGLTAVCFGYWQFAMLTADPRRILDVSPTPAPLPPSMWMERTPPSPADSADVRQAFLLAAALITHFNWFALIVFHGVLVPNTLARGAGVAGGMAALALAISTVAAFVNPATGAHAGTLFTVSGTMLAAGVALSVFGVAKTQALREQVREAREQVRELGQYRLRKRLGAGGMGEVYLAEHRLLKRPCAVKRIHPHYVHHAEQLRRFEREVHATAQLRHPNTVEIYDYGRAEDGTFFYVMEYIPGMSLEDLVTRHGPMPADRVVHVLRQVCAALRESHRQGLVHRDIKPSNILVLPQGAVPDQVKLVDFGLVHELNAGTSDSNKITREGLIVGTPEYMSPEQASGGVLDGRSDLFSLGGVAYFLLTGQEAFNRGNPMKTLLAVVGDEPKPVGEFNPYAPGDLCAVIARCLAKLPPDRYQHAGELDADLAACGCAGQWTETRAAEWWERHPEDWPVEGTDQNYRPEAAGAR